LIGAIVGALIGLIAHAVPRTRNGFTSTSRLDAARYDVVAVSAVAERARQLLRDFPRLRAA
jgi:hypothetical protein